MSHNAAHWWHSKKLREERMRREIEAEHRRQVQEWERGVRYRVPIKFKSGWTSYDGYLVIREVGYHNYVIYLFKNWDLIGKWGVMELKMTLNKQSGTLTIGDGLIREYTIFSDNAEEIYSELRSIGVCC